MLGSSLGTIATVLRQGDPRPLSVILHNPETVLRDMASRRVQKVSEAIREVVSMAILAELKDPRVQDVTVTYVEVARDLRQAKVHVSIMGSESHQRLSLNGLRSASGFLQAKISDRIDLRYTPRLSFILDQGVKQSIAISEILSKVLPEGSSAAPRDAVQLPQDRLDTAANDDQHPASPDNPDASSAGSGPISE